jgi:osmotically inducible lipoprotein OsmB
MCNSEVLKMKAIKKLTLCATVAIMLFGLGGCTLIGIGVGATLGAGTNIGMLGGAVIGGVIGHEIGDE